MSSFCSSLLSSKKNNDKIDTMEHEEIFANNEIVQNNGPKLDHIEEKVQNIASINQSDIDIDNMNEVSEPITDSISEKSVKKRGRKQKSTSELHNFEENLDKNDSKVQYQPLMEEIQESNTLDQTETTEQNDVIDEIIENNSNEKSNKPKRRSSFAASFYSSRPKSERSLRRSNGKVNYFEDFPNENDSENDSVSPIRRKKRSLNDLDIPMDDLESKKIDTDEGSISDSSLSSR